MKILHLSDSGLPDWRIEKSALTGLKNGHEIYFAGNFSNIFKQDIFSKLYKIIWTPKGRYGLPYYWNLMKKQLKSILQDVAPDVVHAHNIFSAKLASEFDIPLIFDDHEFWPNYSRMQLEVINLKSQKSFKHRLNYKIKKKFLQNRMVELWTQWEKEIVSSYPTLTISENIAHEIRQIGGKQVFVTSNFPMYSEIKDFEQPSFHHDISSIYVGRDEQNDGTIPYRNMNNLLDSFSKHDIGSIEIIGWPVQSSKRIAYSPLLTRNQMFKKMFKHSIGLIPWKKHWSHYLCDPNKSYEYAHAGLFIMCTSSLTTILQTLKEHCAPFEDYNGLISQLEYFMTNDEELYQKRIKAFDFAHKNLLWDKHENRILEAYAKC